MPRRFALALVGLLLLLLAALWAGRTWSPRPVPALLAKPRPTPLVPPTPIPPARAVLWFESPADEKLHPEARDLPGASDDAALLRAIATGVLEGPRSTDLLKPFPDGWSVRAAFRLKEGLAVVDLAPPPPATPTPPPAPARKGTPAPAPSPTAGEETAAILTPGPRWETGAHEETMAAQALVRAVAQNVPGVSKVVLLVGGEPAETLAGHLDLAHALVPDPSRAVEEEPRVPPPPTASPTAGPASPTPSTRPTRPRRPAVSAPKAIA